MRLAERAGWREHPHAAAHRHANPRSPHRTRLPPPASPRLAPRPHPRESEPAPPHTTHTPARRGFSPALSPREARGLARAHPRPATVTRLAERAGWREHPHAAAHRHTNPHSPHRTRLPPPTSPRLAPRPRPRESGPAPPHTTHTPARRGFSPALSPRETHGLARAHRRPATVMRLAERAGFEPAVQLPAHTLSKRAPSATRTPLRTPRISFQTPPAGGEGGIRTHGPREGTTVFETAPFGHSGTSPHRGR